MSAPVRVTVMVALWLLPGTILMGTGAWACVTGRVGLGTVFSLLGFVHLHVSAWASGRFAKQVGAVLEIGARYRCPRCGLPWGESP